MVIAPAQLIRNTNFNVKNEAKQERTDPHSLDTCLLKTVA